MKKLLLTFIALFACVSYVAAQETVIESFASTDAKWYTTIKDDAANETTLTSTNTGITYNSKQAYYNTDGYLMLVKSAGIIKFNLDFPCSNITIYSKAGASKNQAVTVLAGTTVIKDNTKIPNSKDGNLSVDVPEASQVAGTEFTIKVSTANNVQITKIVYTKAEINPNLKDADLSFSETEVQATLGEAFDKPTLTKATTAAVTYSSDKETVATVDATTGDVTIVGVGTAKITAKAEANDEYKAGEASYYLTVVKPDPENTFYKSAMGADFTLEKSGDLVVWSVDTEYGYLKGSAYNKGVNAATAYAFVALDLSDKKDVNLIFDNVFNQYKLNNEMIDVADFKGFAFIVAREQGTAEWTTVQEMAAPATFSWDPYTVGPVDLSAYSGKKIELGFKYVSTDKVAGTWEIKNIFVTGVDGTTAIEDIEAADAPVEYYNLQGIRVANPTSGLYIKRQGNKVTKVIL